MQIDFEDVSFRYPGSDRKALSDVSFTITPGSLVCIVGYNGSGKSSMINLMARIVDPTSGRVLISGYSQYSILRRLPWNMAQANVYLFRWSRRQRVLHQRPIFPN